MTNQLKLALLRRTFDDAFKLVTKIYENRELYGGIYYDCDSEKWEPLPISFGENITLKFYFTALDYTGELDSWGAFLTLSRWIVDLENKGEVE